MMQYTGNSGGDVTSIRINLSKIFEEEARSYDEIASEAAENKAFPGSGSIHYKKSGRILLSPLMLLVLAACGGGGGTKTETPDSGQAEPESFSGRVIKGPLGATFVFADRNANGVYDDGEPNTITDSSGRFTLNGVGSATIIATTTADTIDLSSGVVIEGLTLAAPAGSKVITPFTTVISKADGALAASQVSSILGLPSGVNLLSFDPFSEGVNTVDAARIEVVAHQLIATMRGLAAVAEGVGASEQEALNTAFGAIVALIEQKHSAGVGGVDFGNEDDMDAIAVLVRSKLMDLDPQNIRGFDFYIFDALLDDISTAILNVNQAIDAEITAIIEDDGTLASSAAKAVFSTTQDLQSQIVAAVESGSSSEKIEFVNREKVDDAILNAIRSSLTLSNDVVTENDADLLVGILSMKNDGALPTASYSIVEAGDHWQYFEIVDSNELRLKASADFEDISEFNILIDVTVVGGKALRQTFTISVLDVNEAPTITTLAPLNVTKGNTYTYNLSVSDPDAGDQLTITATTLPEWLSFNPETLALTGIPTGDNLGRSEVVFEVSDGELFTQQSFVIDVSNTIRSVIVIVDQFSDRIFQLGHQNLTLFDYGTLSTERWYHSGGNGYTRHVSLSDDEEEGFYQLSYDTDISVFPETLDEATTNLVDYDFITSGFVQESDFGSYEDTDYTDYSVFNRLDQTSDSAVNRGDWALEALLQQLESPEKTAIIAIDLDTLSGANSHYQKLFDVASFSIPESGVGKWTVLEQIIFDWLSANDRRFSGDSSHSDYLVSAVMISVPGVPENVELVTFDYLASLQAPIVQAVPNSTQGIHDWGNNYTDVIHVGAWNVDENDYLLISSQASLEAVDILADGSVSKIKDEWGTNFDTSFAASRVTAEITNVINNISQDLESAGISLDVAQQGSDEFEMYYPESINSILETIGTVVSFEIDDGITTEKFIKMVLSSDLNLLNEPSVVSAPIDEDFAWGVIGSIEVLTSDSMIA
jgi:hypothetical protein